MLFLSVWHRPTWFYRPYRHKAVVTLALDGWVYCSGNAATIGSARFRLSIFKLATVPNTLTTPFASTLERNHTLRRLSETSASLTIVAYPNSLYSPSNRTCDPPWEASILPWPNEMWRTLRSMEVESYSCLVYFAIRYSTNYIMSVLDQNRKFRII